MKVAAAEQVGEPGIPTPHTQVSPQSFLETAPEGWSSQSPPPPTERIGREKRELLVPGRPWPRVLQVSVDTAHSRAQPPSRGVREPCPEFPSGIYLLDAGTLVLSDAALAAGETREPFSKLICFIK